MYWIPPQASIIYRHKSSTGMSNGQFCSVKCSRPQSAMDPTEDLKSQWRSPKRIWRDEKRKICETRAISCLIGSPDLEAMTWFCASWRFGSESPRAKSPVKSTSLSMSCPKWRVSRFDWWCRYILNGSDAWFSSYSTHVVYQLYGLTMARFSRSRGHKYWK